MAPGSMVGRLSAGCVLLLWHATCVCLCNHGPPLTCSSSCSAYFCLLSSFSVPSRSSRSRCASCLAMLISSCSFFSRCTFSTSTERCSSWAFCSLQDREMGAVRSRGRRAQEPLAAAPSAPSCSHCASGHHSWKAEKAHRAERKWSQMEPPQLRLLLPATPQWAQTKGKNDPQPQTWLCAARRGCSAAPQQTLSL